MAFHAVIVFGLVFDFLFQSARSYCVILLQVLLDILQRGFCHPFGLDYQRGRPNLCPASTAFRRRHRRRGIRQCDGNSSKFTQWGGSRYQVAYEYLIISVGRFLAGKTAKVVVTTPVCRPCCRVLFHKIQAFFLKFWPYVWLVFKSGF